MTAEGKFENKPFAKLAALRGKLPEGPSPDRISDAPPSEVVRNDGSELGDKLVVQFERKGRGGKTVTRVRGLELDHDACARLARAMAKALGCGATVEGGGIVLQGGQVNRAATWLREHGAARVIEGN